MTRDVVVVAPSTPAREIARRIREHRVSALPVLDDGRLAGIVSEADLLYDAYDPADWHSYPMEQRRRRLEGVAEPVAAQLMTPHVVSVAPTATPVEALRLMQANRVKRLPVVDEAGGLVGIVSRADLVVDVWARRP